MKSGVLDYPENRKPEELFEPLDSQAPVAPDGWRFNDKNCRILYTEEVESPAVLEVVSMAGWQMVNELIGGVIHV